MVINHLKFAIRLFLRDKFYSFTNIFGLSLGLSCGILVLLYLQNDLTYDKHHEKHQRIYRYTQHLEAQGADFNSDASARELGALLMNDLSGIESFVRFLPHDPEVVRYVKENGEEVQFEQRLVYETDSSIFSIFTHPFIEGNPSTCLVGLNKLVLSETAARKYFGDQSALGKILKVSDEEYKVTGVIQDLPDNSHLKFEMLLSGIRDRGWGTESDTRYSELFWNNDSYLYLLFEEGYQVDKFYDQFPSIFDKYYKAFGEIIGGKCTPLLEPLTRIHFYSEKTSDLPKGDIKYVYAFAAIGIFVVLLACINYINLVTARSMERTGEMGVRKALGYTKEGLFFHVLGEAILATLIALVVALITCYFVLYATTFNDLIGKRLQLDFLGNPVLLLGVVGLTIFIGFLSGIYPAIQVSSIPVVTALKGSFKSQSSGILLRKVLITFQFMISILAIICTTLMGNQIDYMRSRDLGFNKDNILTLGIPDTIVQKQMPALRTALLEHHNIEAATFAWGRPGMGVGGQVFRAETDEGMKQQHFDAIRAGEDYLKTMGFELVAGRDFEKGNEADYFYSYIVNESAVKMMGWGDDAIGKKITFFHSDEMGKVIGVVKDFNYKSLHNEIEPLIILLGDTPSGWLHLRLKGENLPETMALVEKKWKEYLPTYPYEYEFLDEGFDQQYKADDIQHRLISILSYLCIVLSILGLIGLSAFTASQKTKEVGVRKALGASIYQILFLFSRDYLKLIAISFLIAVPVANYLVTEWAGNFAYQSELSPVHFVLPGLLVLSIALIAVSGQSIKAARANPVDALKSE